MKNNYSVPIAIFIMVIGLVIAGIAFISDVLELQIALGLAGVGFVSTALVLFVQVQDKKSAARLEEEKHRQIMEKLEKIEKELERAEQPKQGGVAIADVISSGLKYYAQHLTKPKKEDEND